MKKFLADWFWLQDVAAFIAVGAFVACVGLWLDIGRSLGWI